MAQVVILSSVPRKLKKGCGLESGSCLLRRIQVDRARSPEVALKATGRQLHADELVVAAMPRGVGEFANILLFRLGYVVNDRALEGEYESWELLPADPYSLAAANEADPSLADQYPNATHWRDAAGNRCCAIFARGPDGPYARVEQVSGVYPAGTWFAGLLIDV